MEIVLIDMFTVPEKSKAEFMEQTNIARSFVGNLPGFVEGYVYEPVGEDSQFNLITVVVWENETAFQNAKLIVAEEYQKQGFNPPEIMQKYNVKMTRATYTRTPFRVTSLSSD